MMQTRQRDGRQEESSGLQPLPEGASDMYPIHVASGGGYLGIGASIVEGVPDGFLAAVKYLIEKFDADVNVPDAWGYTPLHYAATRGDNELVQYLVDKGADVTAISRLGMSPIDMTLGGQRGFFGQAARPETEALLEKLGSPRLCKDLHFDGTGTVCPTAGTSQVEAMYGYPTTPLHLGATIGDAIQIYENGDFETPYAPDGATEDTCIVVKLFGVTDTGGVVVVDVRKADILREHPSR